MKKSILAVLITAGMLLLQGCGGSSVTQSTIEISSKGAVTQTTITVLDSDYYDSDELEAYIEDEVEAYNEDEDAVGTVTLKKYSYSEEDQTATLILKFENADTYADFENMIFFSGTVDEAKAAGYSFGVTLIAAEDAPVWEEEADASGDSSGDASSDASAQAESGDAQEITDGTADLGLTGEEMVVILQESYHMAVPGTVLYVTDKACSMVSDDTVSVDAAQAELVYIIYE